MKKLSRRKVLIGAIAAPGALQQPLPPVAAILPPESSEGVVAKAAAWMAGDDQVNTMRLKWQGLESELFRKAKRMKIGCEEATLGNLPEAQAMRVIDEQISTAHCELEMLAADISETTAVTIADAIAKIELGVKVQGPYDWQGRARELLEGGIDDLRSLLRACT